MASPSVTVLILALARTSAATAVTVDRAWEELDLGIEIKLIR